MPKSKEQKLKEAVERNREYFFQEKRNLDELLQQPGASKNDFLIGTMIRAQKARAHAAFLDLDGNDLATKLKSMTAECGSWEKTNIYNPLIQAFEALDWTTAFNHVRHEWREHFHSVFYVKKELAEWLVENGILENHVHCTVVKPTPFAIEKGISA